VRIIALSTLKRCVDGRAGRADLRGSVRAWCQHVRHADWARPADVKADFSNASILRDGRVVFNIVGNEYRLVVWINHAYRVVYIRFLGTHEEYDAIDAQTI
jgi:mRNA interferase HigB